MNQYQPIPYDRVEEFFKDLFGQPFSEGSLFTANQVLYESLEGFEQEIKRQLLNSPVINCDETGARVEGKNHWLHVASTPKLTCYGIRSAAPMLWTRWGYCPATRELHSTMTCRRTSSTRTVTTRSATTTTTGTSPGLSTTNTRPGRSRCSTCSLRPMPR